MNEHTENQATETVSCEQCMKDIPRSEARVEEMDDYVVYFCGLDCYDKWRQADEVE